MPIITLNISHEQYIWLHEHGAKLEAKMADMSQDGPGRPRRGIPLAVVNLIDTARRNGAPTPITGARPAVRKAIPAKPVKRTTPIEA